MNVLIACEESQEVCKAFRAKGHNAYSCDIQQCSGGHPEWHIQEDVLKILNPKLCTRNLRNARGIYFETCDGEIHYVEKWDMIIAHPPCTFMSKAGARWMYKKAGIIDEQRYRLAMQAKAFFMSFLYADCEKIVVENPTPLKIVGLPKPTQKIQPYQYGHPYSKCTLLWIRGLPELKPTKILTEYTPYLPSNTGGLARGKGGSRGIAYNAQAASKTFSGIAQAMANQWG